MYTVEMGADYKNNVTNKVPLNHDISGVWSICVSTERVALCYPNSHKVEVLHHSGNLLLVLYSVFLILILYFMCFSLIWTAINYWLAHHLPIDGMANVRICTYRKNTRNPSRLKYMYVLHERHLLLVGCVFIRNTHMIYNICILS